MPVKRRLARERKTVSAMIRLYCRRRHGQEAGLCPDFEALQAYALARIDHCRYGASKPVCADCPIHCYKPDMREEIRQVMRYAGPRMLLAHPILAVAHLLDKLRRSQPIVGA